MHSHESGVMPAGKRWNKTCTIKGVGFHRCNERALWFELQSQLFVDLIGHSPLVYSFNLPFPQFLQKLQLSTFLPQLLQNIPTTIPCAGTKWRSGQGRVKTGHSFCSLIADHLILFLMSGFCIWCEQFVFDVSNLYLMWAICFWCE